MGFNKLKKKKKKLIFLMTVGSNNLRPWPISTLGLKTRAEEGYGRGWVIKVQIVLRHSQGWFCPRHIRGLTGEKGKNGIGTAWKKSKISRSIEKGTLESITTRESCPYCHSILCTWQSHTLQLLQPPPTTLDMDWWDKYQSWKSRSYTWTKDKEPRLV